MIWQHWFSITHIITNGRLFKHVLSLVLKWVASIHYGYSLYFNFSVSSIEWAEDSQTTQKFGLNRLYMNVAFYGESDFGLYWYCEIRMAISYLHIYIGLCQLLVSNNNFIHIINFTRKYCAFTIQYQPIIFHFDSPEASRI